MNPDEEITISAIAVDVEACANALCAWCRSNQSPYPIDDRSGKLISNKLDEIALRLHNTTRNKKPDNDGISINGKDGRDFNTQFSLEQHYNRAISCLRDSNFICNEKEYHGVNTLILQALKEIKAIGEITKINGVKDGAKKSSE